MPLLKVRDGQSLHVRVLGRGQPVLMLPGLGMSSRLWIPFIAPYLNQCCFYLPDFRGAGLSAAAWLNQADVFQNHMEDVQDIIAHFGLRDFLLAGISLGGSTALHLQRAGGFEQVRRYLHIDQSPCIGNGPDWPYGLFGERQAELFAKMRYVREVLSQAPHFRDVGLLPPPERARVAAIVSELPALISGKRWLRPLLFNLLMLPSPLSRFTTWSRLEHFYPYLSAYTGGGHDYRPSLREGRTPITVFVGMHSPLYHPAGQMSIADYVPASRVVRFEKSGHVPLVDEPLKFTHELGVFLQESRGH